MGIKHRVHIASQWPKHSVASNKIHTERVSPQDREYREAPIDDALPQG